VGDEAIASNPTKTRETTTNDGEQQSINDYLEVLVKAAFPSKVQVSAFGMPDF
jgi:hypothetical protein